MHPTGGSKSSRKQEAKGFGVGTIDSLGTPVVKMQPAEKNKSAGGGGAETSGEADGYERENKRPEECVRAKSKR